MFSKQLIREASHAGSWYVANNKDLDNQLTDWLNKASNKTSQSKSVKAIIGPHAGYRYSGPVAAYSYNYLQEQAKQLVQQQKALTVFLLGPCHKIYQEGCGITEVSECQTPLGNIKLNLNIISELKKSGLFNKISKYDDEDEHSLEMHMPFLQKVFGNINYDLVPLMVGQIDKNNVDNYASILSKYFDQDNTVFVVSSDFCHWGARFRYQYYDDQDGEIYQSIEKLDRMGMGFIENHDYEGFVNYLKTYKNTICGRNPIQILLRIINCSSYSKQLKTQFVQYDQSSQVTDPSDSSVSYAASITYM